MKKNKTIAHIKDAEMAFISNFFGIPESLLMESPLKATIDDGIYIAAVDKYGKEVEHLINDLVRRLLETHCADFDEYFIVKK